MKKSVKHMIANKFLCEMMQRYQSPQTDASFAKAIPMRHVKEFQHHFPGAFRYKYRGASVFSDVDNYGPVYDRPRAYCHKDWATSFAIYPVKNDGRWQQYLK